MNGKRFGLGVFLSGMLMAYGIEYTVESSFLVPPSVNVGQHSLFAFNSVLATMICFFTVFGSYCINKWFERSSEWMNRPLRRMQLQGFVTTAYCLLVGVVSVDASSTFFTGHTLSAGYLRLTLVLSITISILTSSSYTVFFYFMQWERTWRESNELRNEHLLSQFNALKSQVNPHFLFNNLNTLSGLITENPALATEFVNKLANVYRYVLQAMDKQFVELETELNFLEAYIYILKIRFQQGLNVTVDIPPDVAHYFIAPLTLQILLENVVKHNIISAEAPLQVTISYDDSCTLTVKNNVQKKPVHESTSTHVGLQNIYRRYRFLEKRHVCIEETSTEFIVRIPLIGKDSA